MSTLNLKKLALTTSAVGALTLLASPQAAKAFTLSTDFDPPEVALGSTDITLGTGSRSVTFSGGTTVSLGQPQFYQTPPAAYLINGAGAGGAGAVGTIDFSTPVESVSFFAVNGGNGQATIDVFDTLSNLLTSTTITAADISDPAAEFNFAFNNIGSIKITNPGPASPPNPPYQTFVDSFSATAVPEPTAIAGLGFAVASIASLRRKHKKA
ncbi:MAG: PEP-CTERM sorting domain-containing protein [Symploca sp. SIO2G7]|nr:PEP-CTERM sorting domain-containing protein [Symploca sp. SIO2G7]